MSLFKKPKRNFRARKERSDSEDDEPKPVAIKTETGVTPATKPHDNGKALGLIEPKNVVTPPIAIPKVEIKTENASDLKKKHKTKKTKQSVLSFEEEELDEGEVFKVKKSSQSRRLAKLLEKERKQKHQPKDGSVESKSEITASAYGVPNLPKSTSEMVFNGEQAEEMDLASEEEADATEQFKSILESGAIPDAAMIHAARKRRQQARETGDFIAVEETPVHTYRGSNPRLVRDDDNDKSDDEDEEEEGGRIRFTVNTAARDREKLREAIMSANQRRGSESGDDDHDEDVDRWEEEQIRKGVSIPQIQSTQPDDQYYPMQPMQCYYTAASSQPHQQPVPSAAPPASLITSAMEGDDASVGSTASTGANTARIVNSMPRAPVATVPPALPTETTDPEAIRQRLLARLDSMREVHRAHQRELDKVCSMVEDSHLHVERLEEEGPGLARSFAFYQELRGYVTDLIGCLDEKVVMINALEKSMINVLKLRAEKIVKRRQQDIKDQCEELSRLNNKTLLYLGLDSTQRERAQVEDAARHRRSVERECRRGRRRKAREQRMNEMKHYDGMSSDDEEVDADLTRYYAERDRILRDCATVFEDVVDDFSDLSKIKQRFENWRRLFPQTYNEAYIGLCLPKVFSPLVRFHLINWNPLQGDGRSIEDTVWYETLMFYGFKEGADIELLRRDGDANLVPTIVDRVIIPKITAIAENIWDPLSTSQTLRLVQLVKKLVEEYPTVSGNSKSTKLLLRTVATRIKRTLDEDVYLPVILDNSSQAANAFFQRQFWSCVKLLHNILSWQGILADVLLQEMALDSLLNRYILLALQMWPGGCDMEKYQKITSVFPRSWFLKLSGEHTLPQLERFCKYLKNTATALDKPSVNPSLAANVDTKDNLRDIIKILVNIRAMDHALSIANHFSLKDLRSLVTPS